MNEFKVIKCQSCGSSVVEIQGESIAKCSHCGSSLIISGNKFSKLVLINSVLLITLVMFAIGVSVWLLKDDSVLKQEISKPKELIPTQLNAIPKLNTAKLGFSNQQLSESPSDIVKPKMSIVSKVAGTLANGGIYWIVTIRNDGQQVVVRPAALMSLFDSKNRRIEEQKGWSKLSHLNPGEETELLIHIAKPPMVEYRSELTAIAKNINSFTTTLVKVEVTDFIVKTSKYSNKFYEIIGDVYNPHDFQVDFVKVIAVARDENGKAIGLADVYASETSIVTKAKLGFKISAGTFVTATPTSWALWAIGKKH